MKAHTARAIQLFSAAVSVAVLGLAAPIAHADDQDSQYLAGLAAANINTDNPAALIAAGHAACDSIGAPGFNPFSAWSTPAQWAGAGVGFGQINQATIAAGRAYCPDKLHSIGLS